MLVNAMRLRHSSARWPCQERDKKQGDLQRDQHIHVEAGEMQLLVHKMHREKYQDASSAMPWMLRNTTAEFLLARCINIHVETVAMRFTAVATSCRDRA
jgi:hypothetical protein